MATDAVVRAATRLRENLADAKEGGYYEHAWYARMARWDIEALVAHAIGPVVVAEPEPEPEPEPETMHVQALAPDGAVIWEGDVPMEGISIKSGVVELSIPSDLLRVNEEYVIELEPTPIGERELSTLLAPEGEVYITGVGQKIGNIHSREACAGRPCVIHAPSDHHMREWPTNFRTGGLFDIKPAHMERLCIHGVGHPDPDDAAYQVSVGEDVSIHGCDGCCIPPRKKCTCAMPTIYSSPEGAKGHCTCGALA